MDGWSHRDGSDPDLSRNRKHTMGEISQRTNGFKGGIQAGASAYDAMSRQMNIRLTEMKRILASELSPSGYTMKAGIDGRDHAILRRGCSPDGGIWFDPSGNAVAAFESKKQGRNGNAHERWFKNFMFIGHIYKGIRYVTFASGEGCGSGMGKDFVSFLDMHGRKTNILHPDGASFFLSEDGFTDQEVLDIMRKAVTE
jgi:hypothetical protein